MHEFLLGYFLTNISRLQRYFNKDTSICYRHFAPSALIFIKALQSATHILRLQRSAHNKPIFYPYFAASPLSKQSKKVRNTFFRRPIDTVKFSRFQKSKNSCIRGKLTQNFLQNNFCRMGLRINNFNGLFAHFYKDFGLFQSFQDIISSDEFIFKRFCSVISDQTVRFRILAIVISKKHRNSKCCCFEDVMKSFRVKSTAYNRKICVRIQF